MVSRHVYVLFKKYVELLLHFTTYEKLRGLEGLKIIFLENHFLDINLFAL